MSAATPKQKPPRWLLALVIVLSPIIVVVAIVALALFIIVYDAAHKHTAFAPVLMGLCRCFLYLVAVMEWSSRAVLAWRLSNTMDVPFCVSALEEALTRFGTPEIFNTDQGSQPGFNQSSQRSCQLTVSARQMPLQVFSSQGFCEASC